MMRISVPFCFSLAAAVGAIGIFIGACQDYNSNSADRAKYGGSNIDTSDTSFVNAYSVLSSKCISCHTHENWAVLTSTELWINSGYIVAGNANGSFLIQKTINSGTGNMPIGGSPLSDPEYNALLDWINQAQ